MLPSVKHRLLDNTDFRQLVALAMTQAIKSELDRLTIPVDTTEPDTHAEKKLLEWMREKMRTGSVLDHKVNKIQANTVFVSGCIALFGNTDDISDKIVYTIGSQSEIIIDFDNSVPILVTEILNQGYLYGLAGCENQDFGLQPDGQTPVS
jgi:hypothetical protein